MFSIAADTRCRSPCVKARRIESDQWWLACLMNEYLKSRRRAGQVKKKGKLFGGVVGGWWWWWRGQVAFLQGRRGIHVEI